MMHVMQVVADQFQSGLVTETDWSDDEDPEHFTTRANTEILLDSVEVFDKYKPNSHASSKQLEEDVIKRFGRWLHRYKNRIGLKRAVINLLIRDGKDITDETDIGEM